MKRFLAITILLACAALAQPADAQAPTTAATTSAAPSVVTITFSAVVFHTAEAKQQLTTLEAKYASRKDKLKELATQIAELQQQVQGAAAAERATKEQSLKAKQKQLQHDAEELRSDSQADQKQVFQAIAEKVYTFLGTYAEKKGYGMIVERGSPSQPMVWYAVKSLDITEEVAKAYDEQAATAQPAESGDAAKPAAPAAK